MGLCEKHTNVLACFMLLSFILLPQSIEAGLEEERLQRERQETQWVSEAEARAQVLRVKTELKAQERQAVQLESSCRAVERSLGQSSKKLQVRAAPQPHASPSPAALIATIALNMAIKPVQYD